VVELTCTEPNGFATRLYRWEGDVGTFSGNRFTFATTAGTAINNYCTRFISWDGTGGYNSAQVQITVQ
jgi:hypothetical protein